MASTLLSTRRRAGGSGLVASVNLILKNEQEIQKELAAEAKAQREWQKLVDSGAEYARRLAPEDKGDLKASIQGEPVTLTSRNELRGVISAGTDHWAFQEYGTGVTGAASPQPEPGVAAGYVHGQSVGHRAQPFMRPTLFWLRTIVGG